MLPYAVSPFMQGSRDAARVSEPNKKFPLLPPPSFVQLNFNYQNVIFPELVHQGLEQDHSTFITTVTRCQLLCSGGALEGLEGLAAAARQAKAKF